MKIEGIYPVLATQRVAASRDFYLQHFPFEISFEADWYVSLATRPDASENGIFQLAILDCMHPSVPEAFRRPTSGLLLNFEVKDADAEYARMQSAGLPMHLELRSEPWGQRHFITEDPNGVLLDVIQLIPPSAEFAAMYDDATAAALNEREAK